MSIEEAVAVAEKVFHAALQKGLIGDFPNAIHCADALDKLKTFPNLLREKDQAIALAIEAFTLIKETIDVHGLQK